MYGLSSCSAFRSVAFAAPIRFWTLWLLKLLYICLDISILMLFSTRVWPWERTPKVILVLFCLLFLSTLVWHIHQHGYFGMVQIKHPGLLLEVLPRNIGVASIVCLLPSHHSKDNISLGLFAYLKIAAIMSVWFFLSPLGYFVMFCLGSGGCTLGPIYHWIMKPMGLAPDWWNQLGKSL